ANLQPFGRTVDIAYCAADCAGLPQYMPWLQRMSDLQSDAARGYAPVHRKAELALCFEPDRLEIVTRAPQVTEHIEEIGPDKVGQHEAIMQRGSPANKSALLRFPPEPGGERANKELLSQAHLRVGRHFEAAELDEAEPPGGPVGREEL